MLTPVLLKDADIIGPDMEPGDALFFHGRIIHGSYPNTTTDRWRRTFIKSLNPQKAPTSHISSNQT